MVIVDNRPMYRAGIKAGIELMMPECRFSEHDLCTDLLLDRQAGSSTCYMICVRNMSDNAIISNIKKLRLLQETCKIVLYGYQQAILNIIGFFREKINGYLPDNFTDGELRECIAALAANRIYINMEIAIELMITPRPVRSRKKSVLTLTETKVANLLVRGLSPSHIAKEMDRKISTISTIKSNILRKTQVSNVIDLAHLMLKVPKEISI
jgi:DNA-binding NarL/FixJ family response regulator